MYKIPKRVFEAIQVVAEHFGGIGNGKEFIADPVTHEVVPFCFWGIAQYAIEEQGLVPDATLVSGFKDVFPTRGENDALLQENGIAPVTKRMPFDEYCKVFEIECIPD